MVGLLGGAGCDHRDVIFAIRFAISVRELEQFTAPEDYPERSGKLLSVFPSGLGVSSWRVLRQLSKRSRLACTKRTRDFGLKQMPFLQYEAKLLFQLAFLRMA